MESHKIVDVEYMRIGKKSIACCLMLDNGFEMIGFSTAPTVEQFDENIGKKIAYRNATISLDRFKERINNQL